MSREIVIHPNEILRQKTVEVTEIDDDFLELIEDMYQKMTELDGVGIAAPQVGSSLRVCMVELEEDEEPIVLINPKIIEAKGSHTFVEGCLSIPNTFGTVERSTEIVVEYIDLETGELVEAVAEDFLARAIQHEVDHLDDILFIDKMIEEIPQENLEEYYAQFEEEED